MSAAGQSCKSDLKIARTGMVCVENKLRGDITIGKMTVVHPKASIIAEAGPIVIGDQNIIEEQACIINRLPPGSDLTSAPTLTIGSHNVFEVDCHFESQKVGDNNIFEVKSYVGPGVEITDGCTIGAACRLTGNQVLPRNTVVFGSECERRIAGDKPTPPTLQIESLHKILGNYHHLRKSRSANTPNVEKGSL